MIMYCPRNEHCQVSHYVCLYTCSTNHKTRCAEYDKHYDTIKELKLEERYVERYGIPEYPLPKSRKKKRAKHIVEKVLKTTKPKQPKAKPAEVVEVVESVKPKRRRRTKAEMELARAEEAKKNADKKKKPRAGSKGKSRA